MFCNSRYFLRDLKIEVAAAQSDFVVDITGHGGTKLRNVEVWMPDTLATASNVVHTHAASGYDSPQDDGFYTLKRWIYT